MQTYRRVVQAIEERPQGDLDLFSSAEEAARGW